MTEAVGSQECTYIEFDQKGLGISYMKDLIHVSVASGDVPNKALDLSFNSYPVSLSIR